MAVGKEMLVDPLPAEVPGVVWRENYWLTDEALSVYVRYRRAVRQRDALADPVRRQRRAGDRLPLGGTDEQGFHVARHRPGQLAVRHGPGEGSHHVAETVLAMASDPRGGPGGLAEAPSKIVTHRQAETMKHVVAATRS